MYHINMYKCTHTQYVGKHWTIEWFNEDIKLYHNIVWLFIKLHTARRYLKKKN